MRGIGALCLSSVILLGAFDVQPLAADEVDLGDHVRLERLFSFPANCHSVCFLSQSLEQTIDHYVGQSLLRDGYKSTTVRTTRVGDNVKITFTGDGASAYADRLAPFLAVGDIGLTGALTAFADKRWKYNWDFYLPLGLPLTQNKAVQLLHFPPDYVLKEVQDYLQANTTKRWAALLIENGADATETDAYQAIVDIAPVSAPASDGQKLDGIYKYFTSYIDGLLDFWIIDSKSGNLKPLVAFGGPVREYLKDRYGLDLDILGLGEIPVKGGRHAPVLTANHPSRFYNAINAYLDEHKNDVIGAVHMGMKIQHDDLIAACWEVSAAKDISAPDATLTTCKARWENRDADICKLVILQRFPDDKDAAKVCGMDDLATYRSITEAQIEAIEAAQGSTAAQVQ